MGPIVDNHGSGVASDREFFPESHRGWSASQNVDAALYKHNSSTTIPLYELGISVSQVRAKTASSCHSLSLLDTFERARPRGVVVPAPGRSQHELFLTTASITLQEWYARDWQLRCLEPPAIQVAVWAVVQCAWLPSSLSSVAWITLVCCR